jgi:Cu(I)/Ag(I) efflux system membrane fusion protein
MRRTTMKRLMIMAIAVFAFSVIAYGQDMKVQHHGDSSKAENHIAPEKLKAKAPNEVFTCPMHPEVKSHKPGKCPKCKMDLVKKEGVNIDPTKDSYTCPMHSDVKSDKPGKCPQCKMDLVKEKKDRPRQKK